MKLILFGKHLHSQGAPAMFYKLAETSIPKENRNCIFFHTMHAACFLRFESDILVNHR